MYAQPLPPRKRISFQLTSALLMLFVLFVGALGYTLFAAEQRERDQKILNAVVRLELVTGLMHQQALNYVSIPARDYGTYFRDVKLYYQDLLTQIETFDATLSHFIAPHVGGAAAVEQGSLSHGGANHPAVLTALDRWGQFRSGVEQALGGSSAEPRLEHAAEYVIEHIAPLAEATTRLRQETEAISARRLELHRTLTRGVVLVAVVFLSFTVWWAKRSLQPLYSTMRAFERVARGDFAYRAPATHHNEIGLMSESFNSLTARLNALFQLIGDIESSHDLDTTLRRVAETLGEFISLDWAGILLANPDRSALVLEHAYYIGGGSPIDRRYFPLNHNTFLADALKAGEPLRVPDVRLVANGEYADRIEQVLRDAQLFTAMSLPVGKNGSAFGVLVFASHQPNAYLLEHQELISNFGCLVGQALRRTVALENLVVSAVEGLAKLAESRDPETGDHLTRMSLYAAYTAEQLSQSGPYADQVSPQFVREVFRFAPMHDIGKVGIQDRVLLKPGGYTQSERQEMNQHPLIGAEVLRHCETQMQRVGQSVFSTGIDIAEAHHEKFDGSGYPKGLRGEDIPLAARIIAVADVFDALTSKRPYKTAWPVEKALKYLREQAGKHFDPAVVEAFVRSQPRVMDVYGRLKHV